MSNATAALYAYRARKDRQWSALLRKFGYIASADMVAARAERWERMAANARD